MCLFKEKGALFWKKRIFMIGYREQKNLCGTCVKKVLGLQKNSIDLQELMLFYFLCSFYAVRSTYVNPTQG